MDNVSPQEVQQHVSCVEGDDANNKLTKIKEMKVDDLKIALGEMGLSKSGIKVDLQTRLISALEPHHILITDGTNNYVESSVNATEYNDFKRYIITEIMNGT